MGAVEAYRLVEEVWIAATPERVFRALTDPEEVTLWWRVPGAYETTEAEIDLRPGGRYRFAGTSAARGAFEVAGEYRLIEPPRRLEYTWNPDWDDGATGSVVRYRLEARDGGTRLSVEHTGFATAASRDDHRRGWPAVVAALRARVEGNATEGAAPEPG